MKQFLLFLSLACGTNVFSQIKPVPLVLKSGQHIRITAVNRQDAELGMGMQMKNDMMAITEATVTGNEAGVYTLNSQMKKITINAEMMGNETTYDSDRKEDQDSEIGKLIGPMPGKATSIKMDKATGKIIADAGKKEDEPAIGHGMISMENINAEVLLGGIYLTVPALLKPGAQWTDSSTADGMTVINHYKLLGISNGMATLELKGTMLGNKTVDAQGMSLDMAVNAKNTGEVIVSTETGLVQKRTLKSDMTNTINMGGQNMNVVTASNMVTTYEY